MTEGFHRPTCLEPQGLVPGRQSLPERLRFRRGHRWRGDMCPPGPKEEANRPAGGRAAAGGQVCWRRPDGGSEPSRDWILATMSVAPQQPMSPESAEARSEVLAPLAPPRS